MTPDNGHYPYCNRMDEHEKEDCELSWYEMGEYFVVSLGTLDDALEDK